MRLIATVAASRKRTLGGGVLTLVQARHQTKLGDLTMRPKERDSQMANSDADCGIYAAAAIQQFDAILLIRIDILRIPKFTPKQNVFVGIAFCVSVG